MPTDNVRPSTGKPLLDDLLHNRRAAHSNVDSYGPLSDADMEARYVFNEYRYYAPPCRYNYGVDACPSSRKRSQ